MRCLLPIGALALSLSGEASATESAAHNAYRCEHAPSGDVMSFREVSRPKSDGIPCELWLVPPDVPPILLQELDGVELDACSRRLRSTITLWTAKGWRCSAADVPTPAESQIPLD